MLKPSNCARGTVRNKSSRSNETGSSMLSVLILGILLSSLSYILVDKFALQAKGAQATSAMIAQNEIKDTLNRNIELLQNPLYLKFQALRPENIQLRKCLDTSGVDCVANSEVPHAIEIFNPFPDNGIYTKLIGSISSPVFFDANGGYCTMTASACAFRVVATFRPICPSGAAICARALSILVNYSILPAAELKGLQKLIIQESKESVMIMALPYITLN